MQFPQGGSRVRAPHNLVHLHQLYKIGPGGRSQTVKRNSILRLFSKHITFNSRVLKLPIPHRVVHFFRIDGVKIGTIFSDSVKRYGRRCWSTKDVTRLSLVSKFQLVDRSITLTRRRRIQMNSITVSTIQRLWNWLRIVSGFLLFKRQYYLARNARATPPIACSSKSAFGKASRSINAQSLNPRTRWETFILADPWREAAMILAARLRRSALNSAVEMIVVGSLSKTFWTAFVTSAGLTRESKLAISWSNLLNGVCRSSRLLTVPSGTLGPITLARRPRASPAPILASSPSLPWRLM